MNNRQERELGRARWATQKHEITKQLNTSLTDEQHDAISTLCAIRHQLHMLGGAKLFNSNSSEYDWICGCIAGADGSINDGEINSILSAAGLATINWSFDWDAVDSSAICDELGYSEEEREEALGFCYEVMETINSDIERYLHDIDMEHGTNYNPGGHTRKIF